MPSYKKNRINLLNVIRANLPLFELICPHCPSRLEHCDDDYMRCRGMYCNKREKYKFNEYILHYFMKNDRNIDILAELEKNEKSQNPYIHGN
jgi:hypothetical protein